MTSTGAGGKSRRTASKRAPLPTQAPLAPRQAIINVRLHAHVDPERRRSMIAEAAYFFAEHRGFAPGCELDDWLAAEDQIAATLSLSGA